MEVIHSDAAEYTFPPVTDGILSTFALTLMPEYKTIIENASKSLAADGRLVILDFKLPEKWPLWLVKIFVILTRPFGVTLDLAERKPWEEMKRVLTTVSLTEVYGGLVYIASGKKEHGSDNK